MNNILNLYEGLVINIIRTEAFFQTTLSAYTGKTFSFIVLDFVNN